MRKTTKVKPAKKKNKRIVKVKQKIGFTMVEVLIVISIISVLAITVVLILNPIEQFAKSRDAKRISAIKQLGDAFLAYVTARGETNYPALISGWQSNILKTAGEIGNVITVPQVGTTQCGAASNAEGNICYSTSLLTGGPDAIVWTFAESKDYASVAGCGPGQVPIIAWVSSQRKIGLTCIASAGTVPPPDSSNNTYDNITLFTFSSPNTSPTPGVTLTPSPTPTNMPTPPASFDVVADFAGRLNKSYPIPINFLGVGGLGINNVLPQMNSYLSPAGFHITRMGDYIAGIFPNVQSVTDDSQRNWSKVQQDMFALMTAHSQGSDLQPIIVLTYTPSWMESPSDSSCPDATHVRPSYMQNGTDIGYQLWGQMTAAIVHYIDINYTKNNPWFHPMYEIWNEPNGSGYMCEPSTMPATLADQTRLTTYFSLYDSAAPQMRAQAQADGVSIKIGGPAHSYPQQQQLTLWFPAFVTGTYVNSQTGANFSNDTNISNNIDFISYHDYTSGHILYGDSTSMVAHAQDTGQGIEAVYDGVANIVHNQGTYPGHQTTPIYIDEYNSNPCNGSTGTCRNDSVMAPLTNGLYVIDYLNTVFDSAPNNGPAGMLPGGISYFTWSIPTGGFCMFGINDAGVLDCHKNGTLQPYPQYYTYKLLNSLNLEGNSYVNSATSNDAGVFSAAFYNGTTENIIIDNMTATDYPAFAVRLKNPGSLAHFTANFSTISYNISSPDTSISTSQVVILPVNGDYYAIVHLPQLSLAGLSITY